jgi:hypothetical protein
LAGISCPVDGEFFHVNLDSRHVQFRRRFRQNQTTSSSGRHDRHLAAS